MVAVVGAAEWGTVTGIVAAVVLGTSPDWVKWATTARTDATFAFLLSAALLLGHRWLRTETTRDLLALAAVTGLATLAKGIAGAGLVAGILVIEIWRRGAWRLLRVGPLAASAAIFLAIAGSWYAAALSQAGLEFFHKQIVLENVLRFLPNEEGGPSRQHAIWFYVPMLLSGMAPWSVMLPYALMSGYRERQTGGAPGLSRYLVTWFSVVFIVCTLASGKRSNYVLPLYPAAALLVGRALAAALEGERSAFATRMMRGLGALSATVVLLVAGVMGAWHWGFEPWNPILPWLHPQDRILVPRMTGMIGTPGVAAIAIATALGVAMAAATARGAWRALYAVVGAALVLVVLTLCRLLPDLQADIKSFAPFTEGVAREVGDRPIRFFRAPDMAVLYYLRRHVPVEFETFGAIERPGYALVREKDWDALDPVDRLGARVLQESRPASIGRPNTRLLLVKLDRIDDPGARRAQPPS
jgi:4-amino-4-deoxy-L-arabinose transferase-like glycosyltransferase